MSIDTWNLCYKIRNLLSTTAPKSVFTEGKYLIIIKANRHKTKTKSTKKVPKKKKKRKLYLFYSNQD